MRLLDAAEREAVRVAIYFMWYNFGCVHQRLRVTPALEAGISDRVWAVEGIVAICLGKSNAFALLSPCAKGSA